MQMVIGDGKRQRQIKEKRMLPREEVYDGALEDILCGTVTQCTAIVVSLPQIDIIRAVMIVWMVRRKIIRSVLCSIVCNNSAQCNTHTFQHT